MEMEMGATFRIELIMAAGDSSRQQDQFPSKPGQETLTGVALLPKRNKK